DSWSIARALKRERAEADRSGPARPFTVKEIAITDGSLLVHGPIGPAGVTVPKRIDHLVATLALSYEPVRYTIDISQLSLRGSDPAIEIQALSGAVSVRNDALYVSR